MANVGQALTGAVGEEACRGAETQTEASEQKVSEMAQEDKRSKRGFASMDEEKQREIARKGGASVPSHERSFSRNHDLAVAAGRKGGHESGGNFRNDPKRAAEAGRKGGQH